MNSKLFFGFFITFFLASIINAQNQHFSIMYEEVQKQRALSSYPLEKWDSLRCAWYGECAIPTPNIQTLRTSACPLNKRMFGWHSINNSSSTYVWQSISDLSYFSYDVDPSSGNAINSSVIATWQNDAVILAAHNNGVNVNLCATLTSGYSTFFTTPSYQQTLITNLINAVIAANAKGVNIDFEGSSITSTYQSQFISFMSSLSTQLHNSVPNSELSMDFLGSWSSLQNFINQLNPFVDLYIMMGYDYYTDGNNGSPCGPVAPIYSFNGGGNVSNDVNNFLKVVNPNKFILGIPYYGRTWPTGQSSCFIPMSANASGNSFSYSVYKTNASGYFNNPYRDASSLNPYFCYLYQSTTWKQAFTDDVYSYQKKYNVIQERGLAGVAVWELGFDAGYSDLWSLINDNLSICAYSACADTIYDMGGPMGNYHNSEDYTFTIAPPAATSVTLSFLSFDLENGYDYLKIFNGPTTGSPQIGNLTGNSLPSPLIANSGVMTIQFHSDGATTRPGYKAVYSCSTGNPCTDNYEPNDNSSYSYNLFTTPLNSSSASTNINSFIYSGSDQDWYQVNVNSGSYGTLSVNLSGLPANYDMEMYDNGGLCSPCFIAGSYNTGNNSENFNYIYNSFSTHQPPFYIKVYPNNNTQYSQCNAYTLSVSWTPMTSCTFTLPVTSASYSTSGSSNNTFSVNTQAGCAWTATTSDPSWITLNIASGTGIGNVNYSVASNSGNNRTGYIYVQGNTFTITQSGITCLTPSVPVPNLGQLTCPGSALWNPPTINFSWSNLGSPNNDIEIREYPYDVSNIVYTYSCITGYNIILNGTDFTPGKTYCWRMRATTDCDSCYSSYSPFYYFHLAPSTSPNGTIYICNGSGTTLSTPAITVPLPGTVSYQWYNLNTGPVGGNSNTYFVSTTGTYYVKLIYSGSTICAGIDTTAQSFNVNVTVSTVPSAPNLSSNSPACEGNTLSLSATAPNYPQYFWTGPNSFNSNNPNNSILTVSTAYTGTYYCYVIKSGCQSPTAIINVTINPAPSASFTYNTVGNTVTFTNTSTNATSYSWNFGDTQTSTATNPSHPYSANGNYTVCLNSYSTGCNPSSNCQLISIGATSTSATVPFFAKLFNDTLSNHRSWITYDVIQSPIDSGYICIGWYQNNITFNNAIQYYKLDKNGNLVWVRALPEFSSANALKIVKSQNGYLITLNYNGSTIMEIDELGNKLWGKSFNPGFQKFIKVASGGYLGAGGNCNNCNGFNLIKVDNSGNSVWQKEFVYNLYSINTTIEIFGMVEDATGNFYLYGIIGDDINPPWSYDGIIIKVDANGNLLWSKYDPVPDSYGVVTSLVIDNNSDIIFGSQSMDHITNALTGNITKINSTGAIILSKQLLQSGVNVFNTYSGNFDCVMYGSSNHPNITTLNSNFSITGQKEFLFPSVYSIKPTYDNKFVAVCGQYPYDVSNNDYRYNIFKVSYTDSSCMDTVNSNISLSNLSYSLSSLSNTANTPSISISNFNVNPVVSNLRDTNICTFCQLAISVTPSGDTTFCSGGNVTLSTNTGMTNYLWSSGQTTSFINVNSSGNYSVAVIDSFGCTANSSSTLVTVNPLPSVNFSGLPDTICFSSSSFTLIGNPSGGTFSGAGMSANIFNPSSAGLGLHLIVYSYTDSNNCSNSFTDSIYIDICTSINNLSSTASTFTIYPNPTNDFLNVRGVDLLNGQCRITLTNTLGQILREKEIKLENKSLEIQLDVRDLSSGIYFIKVTNEKKQYMQKLMIQ